MDVGVRARIHLKHNCQKVLHLQATMLCLECLTKEVMHNHFLVTD